MSDNMDDIIIPFIENPEKEFYIRELARKLKKSPTTISKTLKKYQKKDILTSEKKLNHLTFKANSENRKFRLKKLYYNVSQIINSGLLEYLEKELNHPEAIGLFGSYAKAENSNISDIDIFIISSNKKEPNILFYEKKLSHQIHLFIISKNDLEKMKKENKELLNNIINGLILQGNLEMFR